MERGGEFGVSRGVSKEIFANQGLKPAVKPSVGEDAALEPRKQNHFASPVLVSVPVNYKYTYRIVTSCIPSR